MDISTGLTFNKYEFTGFGSEETKKNSGIYNYHVSIPFVNRAEPLLVTIKANKKDYLAVMDVFDTLSYESVQRRFQKDNNINAETINNIREIKIAYDKGKERVSMNLEKKVIFISFLKAKYLRGDGLAWLPSGGSLKGFIYPWVFEKWLDMGLFPDFVYAVSAGALFASPFCKEGSIDNLKNNVKMIIEKMDWHQFADPDIKGALTDIGHYKGPIKGDRIMAIYNALFGMKDVYFSDLKIPLFTVSVRTPAGSTTQAGHTTPVGKKAKAVIFCDPKWWKMMKPGPEDVDEYDRRVSVAVRASMSIPVIFKPINIGAEDVKDDWGMIIPSVALPDENHIDGGIFENLPYMAMRRNPNVGYAVGIDLGYSGENPEGLNNAVDYLMYTIDFQSRSQFGAMNDRCGVDEIYWNPDLFKEGTTQGLPNGQLNGVSAQKFLHDYMRALLGGSFFSMAELKKKKWIPEEDKEELRQKFLKKLFGPYTAEELSSIGYFAKYTDKTPDHPGKVRYFEAKNPLHEKPLDSPEVQQALDNDNGGVRVVPKKQPQPMTKWLWDLSVKQLNVVRAAILWTCLILDKLWLKLLFLKK